MTDTTIFDQSPTGMALLDSEFKITKANVVFCELLAYPETELTGRALFELTTPKDNPFDAEELRNIIAGGNPVARFEKQCLKKNRASIWVSFKISRLRTDDELPVDYLVTAEDVSCPQQTEDELRQERDSARSLVVTDPVIAQENVRLHRRLQQHINELATLNEISQALVSTMEFDTRLEIITDAILKFLDVEVAGIMLSNKTTHRMELTAISGAGSDYLRKRPLEYGIDFLSQVADHGGPVVIQDTSDGLPLTNYLPVDEKFPIRSLMITPLIRKGEVIGIIGGVNKRDGPFNPDDQRLLSMLAGRACTAIENAQLHAKTMRRAGQLSVLRELDWAISASLQADIVFPAFSHHAGRLLTFDCLSIFLQSDGVIQPIYTFGEKRNCPTGNTTLCPLSESAVNWVVKEGQPLLSGDVSQDPRYTTDKERLPDSIRSELIMPIWQYGKIIGVWNIGSRRKEAFNDEDLVLAQLMDAQLANAIKNIQLLKTEQKTRQISEMMQAANVALTQSLDLDSVLGALLDLIAPLVPYDSASVLLWHKEHQLAVKATRGYEAWTDPLLPLDVVLNIKTNPILLKIFAAGKSVLIPDTEQTAGWECHPGSEHVRNWLGVPLVAGGSTIGLYSLDKIEPNFFTLNHQTIAETLAAQAAVAIRNAQLFGEIRLAQKELRALSRRLVIVQEMERRHIARELHDEVSQSLTTLHVGLQLLNKQINDSEALQTGINELKDITEKAATDLHRLIADLRPISLDRLGLVAALEQHVAIYRRQHQLDVQLDTSGLKDTRFPAELETALFRIVQEALTNVSRHAGATHVDVFFKQRAAEIVMVIEDDGIGFDPQTAEKRGRLGIIGMKERTDSFGGKLEIESTIGQGTSLFVEVPYVDTASDS